MILLARQVWLYGDIAWAAVNYPYELDYGEGIVWQQAALMFTPAAYGDIGTFPMIVFHYTPLFHATARLVAAASHGDLLISGRIVSIISTIGCGVAVAALVDLASERHQPRSSRVLVAFASAATVACLKQIVLWSLLMRVDMLAHVLSLMGLWFGIRAFRDPSQIYVASVCFLCAVFTKQNAIAAPAALFASALVLQPRLAARGLAFCLVGGAATLAFLSHATDGRILRHVFLYNINRVEFSQLNIVIQIAAQDVELVIAAAIGAVLLAAPLRKELRLRKWETARQLIRHDEKLTSAMVALLYAGITTVMLVGIVKVGATINYSIEWLFSLCILAGASLSMLVRGLGQSVISGASVAALNPRALYGPLLIAGQAAAFVPFNAAALGEPHQRRELQSIVGRIARASKPVVSDDMVLVMRAGKRVEIEPAIAAELGSVGVWDERPYVKRIMRGDFAMFITEGERGDREFDLRYNPSVADAMAKAYPVTEYVGGYAIHLPVR